MISSDLRNIPLRLAEAAFKLERILNSVKTKAFPVVASIFFFFLLSFSTLSLKNLRQHIPADVLTGSVMFFLLRLSGFVPITSSEIVSRKKIQELER